MTVYHIIWRILLLMTLFVADTDDEETQIAGASSQQSTGRRKKAKDTTGESSSSSSSETSELVSDPGSVTGLLDKARTEVGNIIRTSTSQTAGTEEAWH